MKSKLMGAALITAISLGLSGCVLNVGDHESGKSHDYWEVQQEKNRDSLTKLSLGMTLDQVQVIMGTSDFSEAFVNQADKEQVKVLFYRTQWAKGDGKTTKDECTPIVFKNSELVGWGDTAYKQI
ncbi:MULTISPECIES: DUF3192 domain-containing protein [Shewanella]|jgi:hypothetical protein|uniref:DUF3192 domain-containing protein n=1 Tax=Shewanella TaxID=22 RepID=UPI001CF92BF5|nr:DUF3192 domain-containing protein [Shewanella glacialimarina]UCX04290.1 DUF3192 domain-containing protein [Shewanella glacialimarina]